MDMTREEFERKKAESAKRIKELYRGHTMPPYPEFVTIPREVALKEGSEPPKKTPPEMPLSPRQGSDIQGLLRCFNMGEVLKSPDSLLILGLILLLLSDGSDEKLILALIFIML